MSREAALRARMEDRARTPGADDAAMARAARAGALGREAWAVTAAMGGARDDVGACLRIRSVPKVWRRCGAKP